MESPWWHIPFHDLAIRSGGHIAASAWYLQGTLAAQRTFVLCIKGSKIALIVL